MPNVTISDLVNTVILKIPVPMRRKVVPKIPEYPIPGKNGDPAQYLGRHSKEYSFEVWLKDPTDLKRLEDWCSAGTGISTGLYFKYTADPDPAVSGGNGMACYIARFEYEELPGTGIAGAGMHYVCQITVKELVT